MLSSTSTTLTFVDDRVRTRSWNSLTSASEGAYPTQNRGVTQLAFKRSLSHGHVADMAALEEAENVGRLFLRDKIKWKSRPRTSSATSRPQQIMERIRNWRQGYATSNHASDLLDNSVSPQVGMTDHASNHLWRTIERITVKLFDSKTILGGGDITRIELMKALRTDKHLASLLQACARARIHTTNTCKSIITHTNTHKHTHTHTHTHTPHVQLNQVIKHNDFEARNMFQQVFEEIDEELDGVISIENFLSFACNPRKSGIQPGYDCRGEPIFVVQTTCEFRLWPPCC